MLRNEAMDEYGKAQKLGQKDYREKMLHGQSPFLPVLDDQNGRPHSRFCQQFYAPAGFK